MTKIDIKNFKAFIDHLDGQLNKDNSTFPDYDLIAKLIGKNKYPELKKISALLNSLEIDKKTQYFSTKTGLLRLFRTLFLAVFITGFVLMLVGLGPSKASMNPNSTLLIVGIVVMIAGFFAFLVLSGVNRSRNLSLHSELINNVEIFTKNFIKEIINNSTNGDFISINDECKKLVMQVSYLYGITHEYTIQTNIYGTEYKKGPFNNIVGYGEYDTLDRRLQYLVSMINETTQSLRNDTVLNNNPNDWYKFFTQNYKDIVSHYQSNHDIYNTSYHYNSISNEITPIKFNKYNDQIERDNKVSDIPNNFVTFLRKIPGVHKVL